MATIVRDFAEATHRFNQHEVGQKFLAARSQLKSRYANMDVIPPAAKFALEKIKPSNEYERLAHAWVKEDLQKFRTGIRVIDLTQDYVPFDIDEVKRIVPTEVHTLYEMYSKIFADPTLRSLFQDHIDTKKSYAQVLAKLLHTEGHESQQKKVKEEVETHVTKEVKDLPIDMRIKFITIQMVKHLSAQIFHAPRANGVAG
jgi:hypothetical protein